MIQQVGFGRKIHPRIPLYPGDLQEAWQARVCVVDRLNVMHGVRDLLLTSFTHRYTHPDPPAPPTVRHVPLLPRRRA